ncbi:uncharacterized protein TNCV_1129851 [Trichonephila clavipes]|nr:uncharacterized protein TNCV_1129851 [Trichonephila clavipes]
MIWKMQKTTVTATSKCTRVDLKIRETVVPTETEKRSFKLPKIELKKFSGEAKDFLAFWSQFQKIHNDKGIAEEDKMQYLLQSVEPKSKAERLVLSFPATAENYPKAIDMNKLEMMEDEVTLQVHLAKRSAEGFLHRNANYYKDVRNVTEALLQELGNIYVQEWQGKYWTFVAYEQLARLINKKT